MLQQVSEKLLGQFVESLEAKLAAATGAPRRAAPPPTASAPHGRRCAAAAAEPAPIDLLELAGGGALKKYGPPVFGAFLVAAVAVHARRLRMAAKGAIAMSRRDRPASAARRRPGRVRGRAGGQAARRGVVVSAERARGLRAGDASASRRSRARELYWAARLTLVNRAEDLAAFDAVFEAVFADAVLGRRPAQPEVASLGTTRSGRRRRAARGTDSGARR